MKTLAIQPEQIGNLHYNELMPALECHFIQQDHRYMAKVSWIALGVSTLGSLACIMGLACLILY